MRDAEEFKAGIAGQFLVGIGIADQNGAVEIQIPLLLCLQNQARLGLPALAGIVMVRATEHIVDAGSFGRELRNHVAMDLIEIPGCNQPAGYAALICYHNYQIIERIKNSDPIRNIRQELKLAPVSNVIMRGSFDINHTVAIEENAVSAQGSTVMLADRS